jgi:sphingolipid delta-4 desaturase
MNSKVRKFIFLVGIAFVYAFRPMLFHLKPLTLVEIANMAIIVAYDILIFYTLGGWTLAYLLGCVFLSIGPHPAAMHILAEHFEYLFHL